MNCPDCNREMTMAHNGCCSTVYTCPCGRTVEVDELAAAVARAEKTERWGALWKRCAGRNRKISKRNSSENGRLLGLWIETSGENASLRSQISGVIKMSDYLEDKLKASEFFSAGRKRSMMLREKARSLDHVFVGTISEAAVKIKADRNRLREICDRHGIDWRE